MTGFPRRILIATDGSEGAALALQAAADIASGTGSELHLVHIWQGPPLPPAGRLGPSGPMAGDFLRELEREARELLRRQAWRAAVAGATVAGEHLGEGRPAKEITRIAEEIGADLLVVGSRERGALKRLFSGSVAEYVVRAASRPVLVVRGEWPPSRVVVGDDLSEEAGRAGEIAAEIGRLYGVPMLLTTAYQPGNWYISYAANRRRARETERRLQRKLRDRAAVLRRAPEEIPHTEVAPGCPGDVLKQASVEGDATLVAVGSRNLGAVRRAVSGSVSAGVLGAANGPVLISPSPADTGSPNGAREPEHPRHRCRASAPSSRKSTANERTGGRSR